MINLAIALVAARPLSEASFWGSLKQSVADFLAAIKIKPYAIAFAGVVLAAIAVLTYTSTSLVFAPHVKSNKEFQKYKKAKIDRNCAAFVNLDL